MLSGSGGSSAIKNRFILSFRCETFNEVIGKFKTVFKQLHTVGWFSAHSDKPYLPQRRRWKISYYALFCLFVNCIHENLVAIRQQERRMVPHCRCVSNELEHYFQYFHFSYIRWLNRFAFTSYADRVVWMVKGDRWAAIFVPYSST